MFMSSVRFRFATWMSFSSIATRIARSGSLHARALSYLPTRPSSMRCKFDRRSMWVDFGNTNCYYVHNLKEFFAIHSKPILQHCNIGGDCVDLSCCGHNGLDLFHVKQNEKQHASHVTHFTHKYQGDATPKSNENVPGLRWPFGLQRLLLL